MFPTDNPPHIDPQSNQISTNHRRNHHLPKMIHQVRQLPYACPMQHKNRSKSGIPTVQSIAVVVVLFAILGGDGETFDYGAWHEVGES